MSETNSYSGKHHELIKSRIPPVFANMALHRSEALRNIRPQRAAWMNPEDASLKRNLAYSNRQAWETQNAVDALFSSLRDVRTFAEPLLKDKLLQQYKLDVDVRNIHIRLYKKVELGGFKPTTISLLDAALHNFPQNETFDAASDFLISTDPNKGLYDIYPIKQLISIDQFKRLCRDLDIGARYKERLEALLLTTNRVARTYLETSVQNNMRTALKAAARMALASGDITPEAFTLINALHSGQTNLALKGQAMQLFELGLLEARLTGILLIAPTPGEPLISDTVIAYVPHDPRHPLKQYRNANVFRDELFWQLRENQTLASSGQSYLQFFSQFVDHGQRGQFFARLAQHLAPVTFHGWAAGDPRPAWRENPPDLRALRFELFPVTQPLWRYLYRRLANKVLNDARTLAVPTADVDRLQRQAWWDRIEKIALEILNVAVMVVAPFVPGLGELMLAYTAYQLANETLEGVVDLAEGVWREGTEHIVGVVSDIVQLGAMGAGIPIAREFKLKLSPTIESMHAVTLPNGETRLWYPDIAPYEHSLALPDTLTPDAQGLYRHEGDNVLRLVNRHLKVHKDPASGQYRIRHPNRADAYEPRLEHNGRGAWRYESENPYEWDSATLMRRLGHSTDGLSAEQLEHVRRISATDVETLQRMHADNAPPPLLLDDTLKRFKAFEDVGLAKRRIRTGAALDPRDTWFPQIVTELPGWPPECALKVFHGSDFNGGHYRYGNPKASPHSTLSVSQTQVLNGDLPVAVVGFLDDSQMKRLLGPDVPVSERLPALRNRLADMLDSRAESIADHTYGSREQSQEPHARRLQGLHPELSAAIAERLIGEAPPAALEALASRRRLPHDFKVKARECAFEIRLARAYEGFYKSRPLTADTERLALETVMDRKALKDVRIEIRDDNLDNTLRSSVGPQDASHRRVLLRRQRGDYAVLDGGRNPLFDAQTVYEAILQALPEKSGFNLKPGDGPILRQWLTDKNLSPEVRRKAMLTAPLRPVAAEETHWMLRATWNWIVSFFHRPGRTFTVLEKRVQRLYPRLRETERDTFIRSLPVGTDPIEVVEKLEIQLREIDTALDNWGVRMSSPLPDEPSIPPRNAHHIIQRMKACFRRESNVFGVRNIRFDDGYILDLSKELLGFELESWWKKLLEMDIKTYLDQITVVNLDNMRLSARATGMLKDFPRLRRLSARNCDLTEVPEAVYSMKGLETLRLNDNRIVLTDASVEGLRQLTALQTLQLDSNPLTLPPDVCDMPDLRVLSLRRTNLTDWPVGLLSRPRPRGLNVDLTGSPIQTVPKVLNVTRDSPEAWIVARTRISQWKLPEDERKRLFDYREKVGRPKEVNVEQPTENDIEKWPLETDSLLFKPDPGLGEQRKEAWQSLKAEEKSKGFFKVINRLTRSADYTAADEELRKQLARRVWNVIEAMDLNTQLREDVFATIENPETCVDAVTEEFNKIGVLVLASQAYDYSTSHEELERRLLALAKGAARLESVNTIAREEVRKRPSRAEEVEIYLAYQIGLSARLGLPWQSERMLYRQIGGVSHDMLDAAYRTVLSLEAGDGLVNGMLELEFWENFLKAQYGDTLDQDVAQYTRKLAELDDQYERKELTENEYEAKSKDIRYEKQQSRRNKTKALLEKHNLLGNDSAPTR
ncbi:NEL-type E3 ubiquitin ligase domain-containing protein [Pseudomonas sp. B35(2017)]|uniref:NEL-type E3 ubiquitin ligase domain-containing protein n=1 Tax=Pseudomonas sp. B35(2017) TaxID=1981722 RepID=UPI000A1FB672|nr:NEL-type E3 ubiquitin ligase domain-containing protein [Pseudomonas sp. B35(2017)]